MKAPATPENETDRLNSLRESGLLEIDSSPAFDRLTRLAKRVFQRSDTGEIVVIHNRFYNAVMIFLQHCQ